MPTYLLADERASNTTTTLMLDGIYEQITLPTGITEHKYYVGDAVVTKRSNSTTDTFYLHKDQQGSTTAITNAAGTTVQQLMYDPWGKQFLVNNSILTYSSPAQSKGYTGHEMVNDFEVIHMGGRTYNPTLGRFMQADPFIQQPGNLQSYNRYAYVQNNPMSYTDPSGYFFKKLFNVIKENWRTIAAIAIAVYMPYMNFMKGFSAVQAGALTGFVSGGVATGSLRGAIIGGITGAAFGGLHDWSSKLIAKGIDFGRIAAHGMVGGISSVLSGGKFGHGFAAAGFTQAASEIGGKGLFIEGDRVGNAIKAAAIGGTASVLSGGKFGNGAITGAFSRLLNDDAAISRTKDFESERDAIDKLLQGGKKNYAEAIKRTIKLYNIDMSHNGTQISPVYDSSIYADGEIGKGTILLDDGAFADGAGYLGSTIEHEMMHVKQGLLHFTPQGSTLNRMEVDVYDHQLRNASKFGLSKDAVQSLQGVRETKCSGVSDAYKMEMNWSC